MNGLMKIWKSEHKRPSKSVGDEPAGVESVGEKFVSEKFNVWPMGEKHLGEETYMGEVCG